MGLFNMVEDVKEWHVYSRVKAIAVLMRIENRVGVPNGLNAM